MTAALPSTGDPRDVPDTSDARDGGVRPRGRSGGPWEPAALVAAVGLVPLAVALAVVRRPRWHPVMDYALVEMLVRDVGSADTPLVGLVGRLYGEGQRGSHPGPVAYWLMWPVHRLAGGSAWALQVGAAALNLAAIGVAVWIGRRRAGRLGGLAVALVLVVLAHTYGTATLTLPWNPYTPLLWWVVALLAAWSVLCRDLRLMPVLAFAGTLCVQTHVPYLGLVGGLAALVAVALLRDRGRDPGRHPDVRRWVLTSLGLLAALWLPPLVEQLTADPGNLTVLAAHFTDPELEPLGVGSLAVRVWFAYLDLPTFLQARDIDELGALHGSQVPGAVTLAVWLASVVVARRTGHGPLLRLHLVVGVALACGFVSIARIQGGLASWVVLWAWGTTAVLVLAVGATAWVAWRDRPGPGGDPGVRYDRPDGRRRVAAALTVAVALGAARLVVQAAHTEVDSPDDSRLVAEMAPRAAAALRDGDARYLLRWTSNGGFNDGIAYGLVLELERRGLDVGTPEDRWAGEVPYRWRHEGDADAVLDYAIGEDEIAELRDDGATELARSTNRETGAPVALFVSPAR